MKRLVSFNEYLKDMRLDEEWDDFSDEDLKKMYDKVTSQEPDLFMVDDVEER